MVWRGSNDGELEPTVEKRKKVIRIIRSFKPDVVLGIVCAIIMPTTGLLLSWCRMQPI